MFLRQDALEGSLVVALMQMSSEGPAERRWPVVVPCPLSSSTSPKPVTPAKPMNLLRLSRCF